MLCLEVGCGFAARRLVDVHLELRVVLLNALDKLKSLLEVVEGVEEDQIDLRLGTKVELGNHIHDCETGKTEC